MSYISLKNLSTGRPVAKTLIKYNCNRLEENDGKEKEPINIKFTDQNADPYNDENAIDFRWSDIKEEYEEEIALTNFIENYKSKLMIKMFQKSNWMIVWWLRYRT